MSFIFMSVKEFSDLVTPLKVMVTLFTLFTSSIAPRLLQHWFLLEKSYYYLLLDKGRNMHSFEYVSILRDIVNFLGDDLPAKDSH